VCRVIKEGAKGNMGIVSDDRVIKGGVQISTRSVLLCR